MKCRCIVILTVYFVGILLLLPFQAAAAETNAKNLYERGRFEYEVENYRDALEFFKQALALAPDRIEYRVAFGQALARLGRSAEAEAQFKSLLTAGPSAKVTGLIELAALYRGKKEYAQAISHYNQALEAAPQRADLYLARGSVYMDMGDYAAAETEFEKARQANPELAAAAQFHQALISYRQEDYAATKAKLDKAMTLNPSQTMAAHIRSFKETVVREEKAHKRWAVSAVGIVQYDDNVPLEPSGGWGRISAADIPSGKDDLSYGLITTGTLYLLNRRRYNAGFDLTFRGQFYVHLSEFDQTAYSLGAFFAANQNPWYFRIHGDVGYYYADYDDKMVQYSLNPTLTRILGKRDQIEVYGLYAFKDKRDGTDNIHRYVLSTTHFHTFLPKKSTQSMGLIGRGGLKLEHENADGNQGWDYLLREVYTGLSFPIPAQFEGDIGLGYAWTDYGANELLSPGKKRKDTRLSLAAKVGRSFNEHLRADFIWTHTFNNSNLENNSGRDPFKFYRNVYSLVISGRF